MVGNGMRSSARNALLMSLVVLGTMVVAPPAALAGAGLSATPAFDNNTVQVGDQNRGGTLTLQNANNGADVGATVCRADDDPAGPLPQCAGSEGIVFTPSCGAQQPSFACRPGPPFAPPSGVDPDVFHIDSPAAGQSGGCTGVLFTVTRVPGSDLGKFRFDPPPGSTSCCRRPAATASSASRTTC